MIRTYNRKLDPLLKQLRIAGTAVAAQDEIDTHARLGTKKDHATADIFKHSACDRWTCLLDEVLLDLVQIAFG